MAVFAFLPRADRIATYHLRFHRPSAGVAVGRFAFLGVRRPPLRLSARRRRGAPRAGETSRNCRTTCRDNGRRPGPVIRVPFEHATSAFHCGRSGARNWPPSSALHDISIFDGLVEHRSGTSPLARQGATTADRTAVCNARTSASSRCHQISPPIDERAAGNRHSRPERACRMLVEHRRSDRRLGDLDVTGRRQPQRDGGPPRYRFTRAAQLPGQPELVVTVDGSPSLVTSPLSSFASGMACCSALAVNRNPAGPARQHQDQRIVRRWPSSVSNGAPLITNCVLRSKKPSGRSILPRVEVLDHAIDRLDQTLIGCHRAPSCSTKRVSSGTSQPGIVGNSGSPGSVSVTGVAVLEESRHDAHDRFRLRPRQRIFDRRCDARAGGSWSTSAAATAAPAARIARSLPAATATRARWSRSRRASASVRAGMRARKKRVS